MARIKIDVAGRQSVLPWELLPLGVRDGIVGYGAVQTCVVRYAGTLRARHAPSEESSRVLVVACRSAHKGHADIGPLARREWEQTQFLLGGARTDTVFIEGPQVMARLAEAVADARSDRVRIAGLHVVGHGGANSRGQGFVHGDEPNSQFTAETFLSALRAGAGASYVNESLGFAMLNVCGGGAGLGGFARAIAMQGGIPQVLAYRHAALPDTVLAVAEHSIGAWQSAAIPLKQSPWKTRNGASRRSGYCAARPSARRVGQPRAAGEARRPGNRYGRSPSENAERGRTPERSRRDRGRLDSFAWSPGRGVCPGPDQASSALGSGD
ncbi:MAG: hypothetical protein WAU78_05950 [Roseiarcus sp.]